MDLGILDTPAFGRAKAENSFTTISEGAAYLRKVEEQSDKAHLFFLDDGGTWPVMLLTNTDLSSAGNLEAALSLMAKDGKLKVLYQAQIHGNEPAGGEGALTVTRTLSKDKEGYLNDTDVVLVPYVNRYGAEHFTRGGDAGGLNLNRDCLALQSDSMKRMHWLFNALMPEVFIDSHEFSSVSASIGQSDDGYYFKWQDDVQVNCVNNMNRDTGLFDSELSIVKNTLSTLRDKGFRTFQYKPSCNNTNSCNYARLRNAYSFLVESNGIGLGKNHFERRVLVQHEAVTSILAQVSADSQAIRQKVEAARNRVIERGRIYSDSNEFVLRHGFSEQRGFSIPRPSFDFNGRFFGSPYKTEMSRNADYVRRSRTRPTAYIVPKDTPGAKKAKDTLAANGAKCFQLPDRATVAVRQYRGTVSRAVLGEKEKVTFEEGAYVFYMNQEAANVIAASMEPDVNDTAGFNGSFVQSGVLQKTADGYPVYRFEKKDPQQSLKLKITKQPKAVNAKSASSAKFSVSASGKKLTYKWYYKTAKGKKWKPCKEASASKSALRIKSAAKKKGYAYRCVISNGIMEVTSREAKIKK